MHRYKDIYICMYRNIQTNVYIQIYRDIEMDIHVYRYKYIYIYISIDKAIRRKMLECVRKYTHIDIYREISIYMQTCVEKSKKMYT